jgi:hypothetical protein
MAFVAGRQKKRVARLRADCPISEGMRPRWRGCLSTEQLPAEPFRSLRRAPSRGQARASKRSRPEPARVVFCSIVCQSSRAGCWSRCGRSRERPPGDALIEFSLTRGGMREHRTSKHRVLRVTHILDFRPGTRVINRLASTWNARKFPWFMKNSFT